MKIRKIQSFELGQAYEWDKWTKEMPFIPIPGGWEVAPLPSFMGAVARFWVRRKGMKHSVSVFLDCYEELGFFGGEPYWEIFPASGGDIERFGMYDIKGLVKGLKRSMKYLEKAK